MLHHSFSVYFSVVLVKVKHRKFVILESDLLLTFRTDSCLKVKRNRFDVLLHVVT